MSEEINRQPNLGCGCIVLILIIMIILVASCNNSNTTTSDNKINEGLKPILTGFESNVNISGANCENSFNKAKIYLEQNDTRNARELFKKSHYSCLDAYSSISKIKIPEGFSDEQEKLLKEAKQDFMQAYTSKASASKSFTEAIDKNSQEQIYNGKNSLERANKAFTQGLSKITEIKTSL